MNIRKNCTAHESLARIKQVDIPAGAKLKWGFGGMTPLIEKKPNYAVLIDWILQAEFGISSIFREEISFEFLKDVI